MKRPVLRYHGGKFILAEWIISHFPKHRVYTEVFGGAGSVLLQKKRAFAEIYNDVWGDVVNVFQVLRDPASAEILQRQCELTPFARDEYDLTNEEATDPIERARRTIYRSFTGFGSASANRLHSTGFRSNSNRNGTNAAGDWKNYPSAH